MNENILADVVKRTKGEFFIGCVGAVRSGKSTFIKRFIEKKILPFVDDEFMRNKIIDELPQSASGKTIMTVEPKFVPNTPISININEELQMTLRLVDSVGYIIPNSLGYFTDEGPRMVKTPWFEEPIPFKEAAEIGTKKVIENHSSIGIVMTSDGTINEFSREDYASVEGEIIKQLIDLDKPFVIVLNSKNPNTIETQKIKNEIEKKYDVMVLAINVDEMTEKDIDRILKTALSEFKIEELNVNVPSWLSVLNKDNSYKVYLDQAILDSTTQFKKFKNIENIKECLKKYDMFKTVEITDLNASLGKATITITCDDSLYYKIIDEMLLGKVKTREEFIEMLQDYIKCKDEYEEIKEAIEMVKKTGYGVSIPSVEKMHLEKPEVIKQGSRYGVKLKAIAPSIHMIRVDVESVFEPIIGSHEQSKLLIDSLDSDSANIWNSQIFGRPLSSVVNDGIRSKIFLLPENAKQKFRETLEKIVNNGTGGVIAIIL